LGAQLSSSLFTPKAAEMVLAPMDFPSSSMIARMCDLRILLVEDNHINLKLMRMFLRKLGCNNVRVAGNGVECLDILRAEASVPANEYTQCILMDISMPLMDGKECTRHIRCELQYQHGSSPVYIVAQTANCTNADRLSFQQCGMDDFLPKPISIQALTATLLGAHHHHNVQ
jgi:CheY-like chemotaxis protein